MPTLRICTGSDNFKKLVTEGDIFVDKTLFIKEVLESGKEAILITRPRRWGKSLALDMLKTFLSIEVDKQGQEVPENSNKILFTGGKYTYEDGRTSKTKELPESKLKKDIGGENLINDHQGVYPVIYITLKDAKATDYNNLEFFIRSIISETFTRYSYIHTTLKNKQEKSIEDHKDISMFENLAYNDGKKATIVELKKSLKFLTELLYKYHHKKVYVLIDEADKPVNYFLEQGIAYNVEERKKVTELITSIMGTCGKTNDYLKQIILTGVFDTFIREGNSGFNNLESYGIGDILFAESFGFTSNEIEQQLIQKFKINDGEKKESLLLMKQWYNGYRLPLPENRNIEVYTAWAVMKFISALNADSKAKPKAYWEESGVNWVLEKLTISTKTLGKLKDISSHPISLESFTHNLVYMLSDNSTEPLITYLLFNGGYLTLTEDRKYKLPNQEVTHHFMQNVLGQWLKQELSQSTNVDSVVSALSKNLDNKNEFIKILQEQLLDKIKNKGDKSEAYFQSLVGGVIEYTHILDQANYHVLVEKTVGIGRIDNIFYPTSGNPDQPVIIHEYKMLDRTQESEITLTLQQSIWQILEKGYLAEPLSKKSYHSTSHTWNCIEIRGLVFIRDDSNGSWSVKMSDTFTLSIAQATQIRDFFANPETKKVLNIENKNRNAIDTRGKLLAVHSVKTLKKLIEQKQAVIDQDSVQDASFGTTSTADVTSQTKMILSPAPETKRSRSSDRDDIHGRALQTPPRSENTEGPAPLAASIPKPHDVDASKLPGNQLILSHQKSYGVAEYYVTYYGAGINELLYLRIIDSELSDVVILKSSFLSENTISYLLDIVITQIQDGFSKVVLPLNMAGKHWVGLIIEKQNNHLDIKYLDSENKEMPLNAKVVLSIACAQKGLSVTLKSVIVEEQKYSNCGPELVENFVMVLTGTRATQEAAVPLHSLLYENSVLDLDSSALQIAENSRMIEQLSNQNTPLYRISTLEPKVNAVITYYDSKPLEYNTATDNTGFINILQKILEHVNTKLDSGFKYVSTFFKSNSYTELQSLANKYDIDIEVVDANSARNAYKKIAIKTHPDKVGGNAEDFKLVKELSEQHYLEVSINYNQVMSTLERGHSVVRVVRTVTEIIKVINEPEQANIISAVTNLGYLVENLASKSIGVKYFSGVAIGCQIYQGDFNGALTSTTTMAAYALPGLLMTTAPALAVTLKIGFIAYDAYYAATELYDVFPAIDLAGETNPFGNVDI